MWMRWKMIQQLDDSAGGGALQLIDPLKDSIEEIVPESRWKTPIPLSDKYAPDLPIDMFPDWIRDYLKQLAEKTETPQGLGAMFTLSMLGRAAQQKFAVYPGIGDWLEPVNVWTFSVMKPGTGKSRAFNTLIKNFENWQKRKSEALRADIEEQNARNRMYKKRIDTLEAKAASDDCDIDQTAKEVAKLKAKISNVLKAPKLYTADATSERFETLLAENDESMAVMSPESGMLGVMCGMYNRNGESNLDIYLKSHSGDPHQTDRMGRNVQLNHPLASFGISVQPKVFAKLAAGRNSRIVDSGLMSRFHPYIPKEIDESLDDDESTEMSGIDPTIATRFENLFERLIDIPLPTDSQEPRHIFLSDDARTAFKAFKRYLAIQRRPGGPLEAIEDHVRRLPGETLKFAGQMHIAEHGNQADTECISADKMSQVIEFVKALIPHALIAFEMLESQKYSSDAERAYSWILANAKLDGDGNFTFSASSLQQNRFKSDDGTKRCIDALRELQMRGIIDQLEDASRGRRIGRPSSIWLVNPALFQSADGGSH
ncbi:MAG: hypothetical protein C0507_12575 [Cyanobacteria bacterium PR.3.49]|nr:hypothetical protein [Cyanobacteria bacterium PR.3.49]